MIRSQFQRVLVFLGMLLPLLAGCSTIASQLEEYPKVYGGVRMDVEDIAVAVDPRDEAGILERSVITAVSVIDLPFSFVGDTLLLYNTVPSAVARRRKYLELEQSIRQQEAKHQQETKQTDRGS